MKTQDKGAGNLFLLLNKLIMNRMDLNKELKFRVDSLDKNNVTFSIDKDGTISLQKHNENQLYFYIPRIMEHTMNVKKGDHFSVTSVNENQLSLVKL